MTKIKSVTEAFSTQPVSMTVGIRLNNQLKKEIIELKEIKQENVHFQGDPYSFYCGYDNKGNKVFQWRAESCNVNFF